MDRAILHADMNNCYASIELLSHPELRDKPVAVGGDESARHGIVLAKNEIAKRFGVQTAQTLWQARRLCPELVILEPHHDLYLYYSRLAREIYGEYTDQVEPFGLDEAWLDVTGSINLFGCAEQIAHQIRTRMKQQLGLTVSVGVSFNKVFAKLASDMKKPDAVTVLSRENFRQKAWPMPVDALLFVGPATREKLLRRGVDTIGRLAQTPRVYLESWFGKGGVMLYRNANGLDTSPVRTIGQQEVIKSIGNSTTTPRDMITREDVRVVLWMLCETVAKRLRTNRVSCTGVQICLRDCNLVGVQRQIQLKRPTYLSCELFEAAMALFDTQYHLDHPLRSIGLRAYGLIGTDTPDQLSLFSDERKRMRLERLEKTCDRIHDRYGKDAIVRASTIVDPTLPRVSFHAESFLSG